MEYLPSLADHVTSDSHHHLLHDLRHCHHTQEELDEALCLATKSGHLPMTQMLLDFGASPNARDSNGVPLLTGVVLAGHLDIVRCLVDSGSNTNIDEDSEHDLRQYIPLHIALWSRHYDIAKLLIVFGADLTQRDIDGNTALLICGIVGASDMLMFLCANGADRNVRNLNGDSCLHLAIQNNNIDLFHKLVNMGINLDIANDTLETPLLLSARLNRSEFLLLLLNQKHINISCKNANGSNVLMLACPYANLALAQMILSCEVDIKDIDNYNNNILNVAARYRNEKLLLSLLDKFSDDEKHSKGFMGRTVLHWAVINHMILTIHALLECHYDSNIQDVDDSTPLILACKGEKASLEIVDLLLKSNAHVNIADKQGWTALHWACFNGFTDITDVLLSIGSYDNVKTQNVETVLMLAVKQNHLQIIQRFARSQHWFNMIPEIDSEGCNILLCAVKNCHKEVIEFFLTNGCDSLMDIPDKSGRHCVTTAADKGMWDIVKLLVARKASVNVIDNDHKSLLYYAVSKGDTEVTSMILKRGANPDVGYNQTSCLIVACKTGNVELTDLLCAFGATIDQKDHYGRTAFIWAAQSGSTSLLKLLYSKGSNPKTVDKSGDTALTVAAFAGHTEAIAFLIDISDVNHREYEEGMAALQLALSNGHNSCVSLLLGAEADVNCVSHSGNTVLITAVAMGQCDKDNLVQILSQTSLSALTTIGEQGRTVLHWAVADSEVLDLLLQANSGFDIDGMDGNGASPLLLAIAHSRHESAKILLDHDCKLDMTHSDGRQPIHHAVVYGKVKILKMLLNRGVAPDTPAEDLRTPIILASIDGHSECVKFLHEAGVNVNQVYLDAVTPLSVAVSGGHHDTMQMLLQYGAYPDLIGSKKSRPLIAAILNDDLTATKMLLQWGANIEACPDINNHPLSVSALKQRWAIMSLLLNHLCNTNIVRRILQAGAIYYFILDDNIIAFLQQFAKQIPPLQKLCRTTVRVHLKHPACLTIQNLEIPLKLKEYLLL